MKNQGLHRAIIGRNKARSIAKTAEYLRHDGVLYEYRSDTQIFRHDPTRLSRVKKAEWLRLKALHENDK